ncbi:hypothetical protein [Luteolibacter luteus]|uniref:Uncharacterized protein n=1 Tax=Luteolibacter luteus TaxID=2728835 RepID=A0A858RQJ2_9BACT|nr:hypothetical protein [Luteolibacter luteus]QJE99005.1 hypothetical protein HHL09_25570 [Luteolibacter luteus]
MKINRSHGILLALIMIPAVGIWAYREKNSASTKTGMQVESAESAEGKVSDRGGPRPSKKEIRDKAKAWQQRLLEDHPEMALSARQVAAEDNGYLQWLAFIEECRANGKMVGNSFALPEDIKGIIEGDKPWDAARVGKWLDANQELLDKIIALGLLPDHSTTGIDSARLAENQQFAGNLAPLLLAYARHALDQGNGADAIEALQSLIGSARHLEDVETPTYLAMVSAAGTRARILDFMVGDAIADADAATLQQFRKLISDDPQVPGSFGLFARGDWQIMSENYLLPTLLGGDRLISDVPPSFLKQPELIAESYTRASSELAQHWDKASLRDMLAPPPDVTVALPLGLSAEDQEHFRMLTHGLIEGVAKGWALQQIEKVMTDAALAIALGEEPPVEPVSGKPFVIGEGGILKLPDDPVFSDAKLEGLRIPKRKN